MKDIHKSNVKITPEPISSKLRYSLLIDTMVVSIFVLESLQISIFFNVLYPLILYIIMIIITVQKSPIHQ